MAGTYDQIYLHIVFAVAGRQALIRNEFKDDLYKYITGIVQRRGHKLLAVNGMPDHIHLLIGLRPDIAVSDLVRDIKAFSSKYINHRRLTHAAFRWQTGYGVFSLSRSALTSVIHYIDHQEQHHRIRSFRKEYTAMLDEAGVKYDERYTFT